MRSREESECQDREWLWCLSDIFKIVALLLLLLPPDTTRYHLQRSRYINTEKALINRLQWPLRDEVEERHLPGKQAFIQSRIYFPYLRLNSSSFAMTGGFIDRETNEAIKISPM